MNHVERFRSVMNFQPFDRLPKIEWAMWWDDTITRWKKEGLPQHLEDVFEITQYFGLDPYKQFWISTTTSSVDAEQHHVEGVVKDMDDYLNLKPNIFPDHNFEHMAEWSKKQENGDVVVWISLEGFFWFPRTLLGIEEHMYAFYDMPELIHTMNRDVLDYNIKMLRKITKFCKPTFMTFAEDMSYNHGPMLSKDSFYEFLAPYYHKIIEVLNDSRYKKLTLEDKRDIMLEVVDKFIKNDIKLSGNDAVFASITVENLINIVVDKSLGKTLKRANKKHLKITDKLSIGSIIESIVNKVTGIIDERDYSVREIIANIAIIVGIVITLVEKYKKLTNVERKNITIRVIKKILTSKLEDSDLDDELKILIEITITTLPDMIDAVVSIAKGKGLKDSVSKVCCFNLLTQVISIVGKHK